jgi:D-sedoheptulose 7-phosphate isomerase
MTTRGQKGHNPHDGHDERNGHGGLPGASGLSDGSASGLPMLNVGRSHLAALRGPITRLEADLDRLGRWGSVLAGALDAGHRLLAVGNGGSAAQAQHLTSELVGRYRHDRRPLSAIALHAETSTLTALVNDYPPEQVFARQVEAHGRPGDVLVALSTSGESGNVLAAAATASAQGLLVWALTGPVPNTLARLADDVLSVESPFTATVQEIHQIAIHLLCASLDVALGVALPVVVPQLSPAGGGRRHDAASALLRAVPPAPR